MNPEKYQYFYFKKKKADISAANKNIFINNRNQIKNYDLANNTVYSIRTG